MSQLGDLLREASDGGDRARSKWRTLKRRLRLKGVSCCGVTPRSLRPTTIDVEDEEERMVVTHSGRVRVINLSEPGRDVDSDCLPRGVTNLAEALAAERHAREESVTGTTVVGKNVPLMSLMAESDGCDSTWLGCDPVCCVCMGREKGAAMIPCGHTYCRVCCREIWVDRGTCPLCNRPIFDVLDLY